MDLLHIEGPDGLRIGLAARGASWLACRVPMGGGHWRDAVLGFDDAAQWQANRAYVGATVGRWANRIAGAQLQRGGRVWPLATGPGMRHQLHGGPDGFDRRAWTLAEHGPDQACFTLHSPAGDQGFPGEVRAQVRYRLLAGLAVQIDVDAEVRGEASPVCLSHHAYFQLDGRPTDVRRQTLALAAARVQPVDAEGLPAGGPVPVAGTALDYLGARPIARAIDHAFVLDAPAAAELVSTDGRLALQVHTTLPALQVYTGEFLGNESDLRNSTPRLTVDQASCAAL
ncbi:MAG: hypothetical protein U1F53_08900, partial [Burkholderiaceae bacterium]